MAHYKKKRQVLISKEKNISFQNPGICLSAKRLIKTTGR